MTASSEPVSAAPTTWEYVTVPLITHATKQILDQWGADGWELVQVVPRGEACMDSIERRFHLGG
ncbi:hypothetical protein, partial [Actinomyces sp.]|uniref:hypothetical protein n=1 Tax=Actinomyces sp. TaxID=29317 RepID=UPI00360D69E3